MAILKWCQRPRSTGITSPPQANAKRLRLNFNGSFRDECLNETLFSSLAQARAAIAEWKEDQSQAQT